MVKKKLVTDKENMKQKHPQSDINSPCGIIEDSSSIM